ncbi:hypothetical protein [Microbacterium sp.]|uniref:hypothetical protein n=1 Tax=Microbacterium sp. TaxID=51671 RepID=UPI0004061906
MPIPLTLSPDETVSLRAAMRDAQITARDYYNETARTGDLDALATRARLFVGAVQVLNDWLQQVADAAHYAALFDSPRDKDADLVDAFRYARNVTQHVLHPVAPDQPNTLIGGLHGLRVYASWAEIPAAAHQRLYKSTQILKAQFESELRGREVTSTMIRVLHFFARVAPDIVAREETGEWVGFPLPSQPGVIALLHPEEPSDLTAAHAWLDGRRPGGDARLVCGRLVVDGVDCVVGFTFVGQHAFLPFAESVDQVAADMGLGYRYVTGDIASEVDDVSVMFGGRDLVLFSRHPLNQWTVPFEVQAVPDSYIYFGDPEAWGRQIDLNAGDYLVRRAQRLNAVVPDS